MTINQVMGFAAKTTHGEVDDLRTQEFAFISEVFNLTSETITTELPRTTPKRNKQLELF